MKNIIISSLFSSTVIHERFIPFKNRFMYSVLSAYLDYDELNLIDKKISFFSYNKFNLFSFYDCDHGYRDNRSIKEFVLDTLSKNNIKFTDLNFKILSFPRILGYVFNPLSIIFCFNKGNLVSILYEVKNTPNEQHTYCFTSKDLSLKSRYQHSCKKKFYVSPFIEMDGLYKFSTKIPSNTLSILIELFNNANKKILLASQTGKKINFTSATLLKFFLTNPMMTLKVIFAIHYQAIKIFFKGGKYYTRNKKNIDTVSFEGKI